MPSKSSSSLHSLTCRRCFSIFLTPKEPPLGSKRSGEDAQRMTKVAKIMGNLSYVDSNSIRILMERELPSTTSLPRGGLAPLPILVLDVQNARSHRHKLRKYTLVEAVNFSATDYETSPSTIVSTLYHRLSRSLEFVANYLPLSFVYWSLPEKKRKREKDLYIRWFACKRNLSLPIFFQTFLHHFYTNFQRDFKGQIVFIRNQKTSGLFSISWCTSGVRISAWYGWKSYSIYYNSYEEIGIRISHLQYWKSYDHLNVMLRIWKVLINVSSMIPLLTLSVLRNNDAFMSAGWVHDDKDDESVRRAPLHRRACKRLLYWVCPTQRRFVIYFIACVSFRSCGCIERSRQTSIEKSVVGQLYAVFWSNLAGSPRGGVTVECKLLLQWNQKLSPYLSLLSFFMLVTGSRERWKA
uniref:Uncharacterized protein n=1 Tax=Cucumis melo TaxID=3656 RepID=A0A9I9E774_CUCME